MAPSVCPELSLILCTVVANVCLLIPNTILYTGMNFPQKFIMAFLNESIGQSYNYTLDQYGLDLVYGALVSLPMLTAIPSAILARKLCDKVGRKLTAFLGTGILQAIASCCFGASRWFDRFELMFAGRAIFGCSFGCLMSTITIYIAECTPPRCKGQVASITFVIGGLALVLTNSLNLPQVLGSENRWHLLYAVALPISLFNIVLAAILPESPKFTYIRKKDSKTAIRVIQKFYGPDANVESVIKGFEAEKNQATEQMSLVKVLKTYHLRKSLIISVLLACFRGTSGAAMLLAYSVSILNKELNLSTIHAKYILTFLSVVATLLSIFGALIIDKIGRRIIYLGITLIMLIFLIPFLIFAVLTKTIYASDWFTFAAVGCIFIYWSLYYIAPNTFTMYYVTEITPQFARSKINSIAVVVSLLVRFLYFLIFPILEDLISVYSLLVLVAIPSLITWFYLFMEMPETRNRAVHEVVQDWVDRKPIFRRLSSNYKISSVNPSA